MCDCVLQYTGQVLVLMAIRWGWYRAKKWHYYLLDFCYFANLSLLVHLWLLPRNALLNKVRITDLLAHGVWAARLATPTTWLHSTLRREDCILLQGAPEPCSLQVLS